MALLSARGVSKRFGATTALDDVSLSIEKGEIHSLVGENGSGKSTLMKLVAGIIQPDAGSFEFEGQPYRPRGPLDARRAGIAMIHQELSICGDLTVAENVFLGVEHARAGVIKGAELRRRAREALAQLGHGDLDPDTPAKNLSIAVQQIVEIARSVAASSRLVIMDEPTSSLTAEDTEHLFEVIRKLKASGCSVIYISHFLNEIRALCDTLTVLRDGKMIEMSEVAEITDSEIVHLMVGREISELYPRSDRQPGEILLKLDRLVGRPRPAAASLEVRRGEIVGIAGLNGSGRTELIRAIFGLEAIKSGTISFEGIDGAFNPQSRWRQGVGMLSENRKEEGLFLNLPIYENITMAGLDSLLVNPRKQTQAAAKWVDRLRVKCAGPEQPVGQLSGGNQQKVALARLLEDEVDLLLLDEPTRGIDVGSKEQIYRLIDELAVQGKAILMVSSYLPELLGTCDRIAVMNRGHLSDAIEAKTADQEILMNMAVNTKEVA